MEETIVIRVCVGMAGGFVMGMIFYMLRWRSGLTGREWLYLAAFRDALRRGTYEDNTTDGEKGEKNMEENVGINWAAKLSSRKFWLAVTGLVSGLMLAFGADENTVNSVTGVIMAAASVIAFCIGEGLADAAGAKAAAYAEAAEKVAETKVPKKERQPPDPMEDDLK